MKSTVRITVPYAVANYVDMRERGFYYVDKTMFIPNLELYNAPVFLRPRRFGKSLLVSMLAAYYDLNMADRFTELFGDTYVGSNPTKEHNKYLVLRFDFSKMVVTDTLEGLQKNFNDLNCGVIYDMVKAVPGMHVYSRILNLVIKPMSQRCWRICCVTYRPIIFLRYIFLLMNMTILPTSC